MRLKDCFYLQVNRIIRALWSLPTVHPPKQKQVGAALAALSITLSNLRNENKKEKTTYTHTERRGDASGTQNLPSDLPRPLDAVVPGVRLHRLDVGHLSRDGKTPGKSTEKRRSHLFSTGRRVGNAPAPTSSNAPRVRRRVT